MRRHASSSSQCDSFGGDGIRRVSSPLLTREEEFARLKLHSELAERANAQFTAAEDLIDKFEHLNKIHEVSANWVITTDVESQMNMFKQRLASSPDQSSFWDLLEAHLIGSCKQVKMNQGLLETNADLMGQLAIAKEIFNRTQTEAVNSLRGVVKESLELLKAREQEAGHWKSVQHEVQDKCDGLNKELKTVQKKADELQTKLAARDAECVSLRDELQLLERSAKDKDNAVTRLTQDLQETRRKVQVLQMQLDQKTDELAALDTDVRKASTDYQLLEEKHKKEKDRLNQHFERMMNEKLDRRETQLHEEHCKQLDHAHHQVNSLENQKDMLQKKLEDYKRHAEEMSRENDYLKRNAKQIKLDLMAQAQRRVFSALNYDSQSSDSPPPPRHHHTVHRSRSVNFAHDKPPISARENATPPPPTRPELPVPPPSQRTAAPLPSRTSALPPTTSQVRKRPTSFIRRT